MIAFPQPKDEVERYIAGVLSGEIVVGRLVKLAVERHVHDLEHAWERGFKFDEDIATRACAFFPAVCRHSLGEWNNQPFRLSPWQMFCIWAIFGWRRLDDGTRRFRKVYMSVARKNGKTTLIAGLALLLMMRDEPFEDGAEIYCAATKEKQAKIMYNEAVRIRNRSPALKKRLRVRKAPHGLHWEAKDSFFCPIGSDSDSTDGLNPHGVLKDELHAWRERHRGLKEKLETGGGARRQPLDVTITTAGDDHSEIWIQDNHYAIQCLESVVTGNVIDDSTFAYIACIDEQDDPFDEACWPKANPNWEVSVKPDSIRRVANEARYKPSSLTELVRYHCNRRVGSLERAISLDVWMQGAKVLTVQDGAYGHGGMDLGRSDDWAAIAACFPVEDKDKKTGEPFTRYELKTKAWTVKDGAFNIDREPFRRWIADGLLTAHEGDQIDFTEVIAEMVAWSQQYSIATWAYDPNCARLAGDELQNTHGLQIFKFIQSQRHYNEPCMRFVETMKAGRLWHGNDPVLEWQAGNLEFSRNNQGLVMPDKSKREFKIDGLVAGIMAFSECLFAEKETGYWSPSDGVTV